VLGLGNSLGGNKDLLFNWRPSDVNGLTMWHKHGTIDSAPVSEWTNEATGTEVGNLNGSGGSDSPGEHKGGADFDGSNDFLFYESGLTEIASFTLGIVYEVDDFTTANTIYSADGEDPSNISIAISNATDFKLTVGGENESLSGCNNGTGEVRSAIITRSSRDRISAFQGTSSPITNATLAGAFELKSLGRSGFEGGGDYFSGKIYEVMFWKGVNFVNSTDDLEDLVEYLNNSVTKIKTIA